SDPRKLALPWASRITAGRGAVMIHQMKYADYAMSYAPLSALRQSTCIVREQFAASSEARTPVV
ncbi:hypothetical protein, partial [Arthrobacter sp. VKM Ac-2550]|uniref:hypothetical protein n=1 Tax=Crystallibacter permensis TaxID=1938888 RepID=UPI002227855A